MNNRGGKNGYRKYRSRKWNEDEKSGGGEKLNKDTDWKRGRSMERKKKRKNHY